MTWHLPGTLTLLAAAAAVVYLTPPIADQPTHGLPDGIPETLGGWTSTEGTPEALLPRDPNERAAIRRTYRKDGRQAFVSVALFTRQDDPARRASINLLYPQRGASLIERSWFDLKLGRNGDEPVWLPAVVVHEGARRLAVLYWHQIGRQAYSSEYRLRLVLLGRILFARRADMLLVRIAVPATGVEGAPAALRTAGEIAPLLSRAIAELGH